MDTFSTAMRVLSRRGPSRAHRARADRSADGQYLVMPRDDWGVTVDNQTDMSPARRRLRIPLHLPSRRQSYATSGRAQLIARRRRIALGFAALVIGLALSAEFAHTSWWFELGAGLALAGYLIHLRTEAIRTSEMRRRRLARAARAAAPYAAGTLGARTAGGERYYAARVRHDADIAAAATDAVSAVSHGVRNAECYCNSKRIWNGRRIAMGTHRRPATDLCFEACCVASGYGSTEGGRRVGPRHRPDPAGKVDRFAGRRPASAA